MDHDIQSRLTILIADKMGISIGEVNPQCSLADLQADSLDAVEILILVEAEFGIDICDEDAENLRTVGDLERHIFDASAMTFQNGPQFFSELNRPR
ncbi:MAG: acyl carrier protein [Steroidobacteraceae bacterium]